MLTLRRDGRVRPGAPRRALLLMLVAVMLVAAGCGTRSEVTDAGDGGGGGGGGDGGDGGTPSVGVAAINLNLPFFVQMKEASEEIADAYGVEVTWQSADGSLEREISVVQDFIAQRKDVIMIDPLDANALAPVVDEATSAGIDVITMGNKVAGQDNHNTLYPDHDNFVMLARILGTKLGGQGKVLLLIGSVGNYVSDTRQRAFEQTMAEEFPGIQVITQPTNFDGATAASVTQTVLTDHSDLAGVASVSDGLTLPALKVLEQQGKLGMPFVTNDGDPQVYPYIERGEVLADVLTGAHRVGAWNAAVAARVAGGATFDTDLFMPTYLVTSDAIAEELTSAGVEGLPDHVTPAEATEVSEGYMEEFGPDRADGDMTVGG